jgi:threonine synthase
MAGLRLRCAGCGAVVAAGSPFPWACPGRRAGDDVDHVLVPQLDQTGLPLVTSDHANPFIRYRARLWSYALWCQAGRDDQSFVALVEALDAAVAGVAGHGFRVTPLGHFPTIDTAVGARVLVKDETNNVARSHKGRHLFGVLVLLRVLEEIGLPASGDLVIASCGNAAVAASVMAAASGRRLTAFVPVDADPETVAQLTGLGTTVEPCPRDDRPGDPCYRRFRQAVAGGALPFSCQGPDNGAAIEGAVTLAWEVVEARPEGLDRVVVQVGGGALATACARGLAAMARRPVFDTVQTAGAHPLQRAVARLRPLVEEGRPVDDVLTEAARHRSRYMWPWESEPVSVARGILDDETYDWRAVADATLSSGGSALVASEALLTEANQLGRAATGIDVDETGSAGLAGLLRLARDGQIPADSEILVLFTGAAQRPPLGRGHQHVSSEAGHGGVATQGHG